MTQQLRTKPEQISRPSTPGWGSFPRQSHGHLLPMWSPAVALPGLGPRGGPLSQPCLEPDSLCPSALCFPASGLGASQSQQVLNLFLRDCLRLRCPCVPKLEPASRPSSGWPEHCSTLLFQGRGQWGRGLAPSPSPDALPKIASLLLPAVPWRPGSEAAFVRSEVQLGWALWASRSHRKALCSKPKVQPRAEGSPPRAPELGEAPEAPECPSCGQNCTEWGLEVEKSGDQ